MVLKRPAKINVILIVHAFMLFFFIVYCLGRVCPSDKLPPFFGVGVVGGFFCPRGRPLFVHVLGEGTFLRAVLFCNYGGISSVI